MNKYQRNKNRENYAKLVYSARIAESMRHTCLECGEKGYHWVYVGDYSLEDIMEGREPRGYWTCSKPRTIQ